MGRMRGVVEQPTGLRYIPSLLNEDQERELLERVRGLQFDEVRMHGQVARRLVRHFGVQYAFESAAITPGPPIPDWLTEVRDRAAQLLDVSPAALAEVLVTYYPPGATIGWHPGRSSLWRRGGCIARVGMGDAISTRPGRRASCVSATRKATLGLHIVRLGAEPLAAQHSPSSH